MSYRIYYWILIFVGCAAFFHRRSEFDKGLERYQQSNFQEAVIHFNAYYVKHPDSDTTLYYLYDCYKRLNQPERGASVLEQLVKAGTIDENVYSALFSYYRKTSRYKDLYTLLINLDAPIKDALNKRHVLTRRLYAEIISGATNKAIYSDPMVFAVSEGYIPLYPDGNFYDNDRITNGNLIILLDKLLDPIYPQKFFRMKNISSHSFLYLPYMRLVHFGIIEFDPELNPDEHASITTAVSAVTNLRNRGCID